MVYTDLAAFVRAILRNDPEPDMVALREDLVFCPMVVAFQDRYAAVF